MVSKVVIFFFLKWFKDIQRLLRDYSLGFIFGIFSQIPRGQSLEIHLVISLEIFLWTQSSDPSKKFFRDLSNNSFGICPENPPAFSMVIWEKNLHNYLQKILEFSNTTISRNLHKVCSQKKILEIPKRSIPDFFMKIFYFFQKI